MTTISDNSRRPDGKLRVALLHYTAPPVIGGVEGIVARQARLLVDHGYETRIVAGRAEPFDERIPVCVDPLFDSRSEDVSAVQVELARGVAGDAFRALLAQMDAALERALAGCDVCIAHNVASLHKNLALTQALKKRAEAGRVRLIAWCHDFAWSDPRYRAELHEGEPWQLLRTQWAHSWYVTVSEAQRETLSALRGNRAGRVHVIGSGVDPAEFLGIGGQVAGWAAQFGWWEAQPVLLAPVRVTRRKNLELAIEITAALAARGRKPQLIVMGPPGAHNAANAAYLEDLQALCAKRGVEQAVVFLHRYGAVDDAARRDLYLLADAILLTSTQEGFGIPVLEAGLARVPVFCSDLPPLKETAGPLAHTFSLSESPQAIAERIDTSLQADRAQQLRHRVLRAYDWESIWRRKLEPLLREVLA